MLKILTAKGKHRVQVNGKPASLVPPVFEQRFTGLQQGFRQSGIKPFQAGHQDDGMAAGPGHGYGVQLKISEASDKPMSSLAGPAVVIALVGSAAALEAWPRRAPWIGALTAAWTALPMCVHLIGPARAKQMVILAEKVKAQTLLEWGFLDQVVPAAELLDVALTLAGKYAAQPPIAAQMVKRSVNAIASALDQSIMHMDADQFLLTTQTKDYLEGLSAFLEKREPSFKGD